MVPAQWPVEPRPEAKQLRAARRCSTKYPTPFPRYHATVPAPNDPQSPPPPPTTRRRLEGKPGEPVGKGCLLWGAALGIVVGLSFAFYGLGPILRHFYGEEQVAPGETYDGSNFTARVLDSAGDDFAHLNLVTVRLAVSGERSWEIEDFKLQHDGGKEWSLATSAKSLSDPVGSAISILVLAFEVPPGSRAEALHLISPRIRFVLQ